MKIGWRSTCLKLLVYCRGRPEALRNGSLDDCITRSAGNRDSYLLKQQVLLSTALPAP